MRRYRILTKIWPLSTASLFVVSFMGHALTLPDWLLGHAHPINAIEQDDRHEAIPVSNLFVSAINTHPDSAENAALTTEPVTHRSPNADTTAHPLTTLLVHQFGIDSQVAMANIGSLLALISPSLSAEQLNQLITLLPATSAFSKRLPEGLETQLDSATDINDLAKQLDIPRDQLFAMAQLIQDYLADLGASKDLLLAIQSRWLTSP